MGRKERRQLARRKSPDQSSSTRVLAGVPAIAMSDIAGYWPQTARPVRGPQEYAKRIIDLLDFIPDFRTRRNVMFVCWIARGTGPKGPFEAVGVDRRNVILLAAGSVRRNGRITSCQCRSTASQVRYLLGHRRAKAQMRRRARYGQVG